MSIKFESNDMVTLEDSEVIKETEGAILINTGDKEIWLPRSQIDILNFKSNNKGDKETIDVEIPKWLALKNELII